jgi:hypothetical protein
MPGLIAVVTVKGLGAAKGDLVYNHAIPLLMLLWLRLSPTPAPDATAAEASGDDRAG